MTDVPRNHPCPCGSGKKYKLCCLGQKEAAARQAYQARIQDKIEARHAQHYRVVTDDPLTNLSNHAARLVQQGRLDEAEEACRQLLVEYPDDIDGHERIAMLLEARGDKKGAADSMRKALAMALTQEGFEEESYQWMRDEIARLDT